MGLTINDGFNTLLTKLVASSTESAAAISHRTSIEAKLKASHGLTYFFRSGSYGNGTNIRGYSDVDYFACIPADKLYKDSSISLRQLKETLLERFPNTTIKVSSPAVSINFGTNESELTEVVPVYYSDEVTIGSNKFRKFGMPDGNSGWMAACPEAHNQYVKNVNDEKNNNVKPLIRLIKAWKYFNNVPISSFYLEMQVAKFVKDDPHGVVFPFDLKNILKKISDSNLASMQDPMGICGYIKPCNTENMKNEALSKVSTAVTRAEKALAAQQAEKISDAFYWWNLLFNENFPAFR